MCIRDRGYRDEAFEVYAFDYLVKPFKNERVLATLERIRGLLAGSDRAEPPRDLKPRPNARKRRDRLLLRSRDGVVFLDMDDILLVQRENRQTVLYTVDGSYTTSDTPVSYTHPDVYKRQPWTAASASARWPPPSGRAR